MKYETYNKTITTDASGDYSYSIVVNGLIDTVYVDYAADVDAGCDLTIVNDFSETVVGLTNNKTDKTLHPIVQSTDSAASGIADEYRPYTANSLTITVDEGGDSKVINLKIRVLA